MSDQEIGQLQANVENLSSEVSELRTEVKAMNAQLNRGAGAIKVLWLVGAVLGTVAAGGAWVGQHLKPF